MAVYVAIISSGAAILAALLTVFIPALVQWWKKPLLGLNYNGNGIGFKVEKDFEENGQRVFRVYIMAQITNNGRTTAQNCRVYLTDIQSVLNGVTTPTVFNSSFQLGWPGWIFDGRELPPNFKMFAEVIAVDKSTQGWRFMFNGAAANDASLTGHRGVLRFYLVATADNAAPASLTLDIDYNGDWHNLRAVRQIVK